MLLQNARKREGEIEVAASVDIQIIQIIIYLILARCHNH